MRNQRAKDYPLADHEGHARSVPADAYWKQVRRTVNGEPVEEAQIILIVNAITSALSLRRDDVVLDLACGNGALSAYLFEKCIGLAGVDISPYLIDTAQRTFARLPQYSFHQEDIVSYAVHGPDTARFTKGLIYGAFQYIPRDAAALLLKALSERFLAVSKVFIGNVPDRRRSDRFYQNRRPTEAELNDNEARLGIWYLPEEIGQMARSAGWHAKCSFMPTEFYASGYRFDVTLDRPGA